MTTTPDSEAQSVRCPECQAPVGVSCRSTFRGTVMTTPHGARVGRPVIQPVSPERFHRIARGAWPPGSIIAEVIAYAKQTEAQTHVLTEDLGILERQRNDAQHRADAAESELRKVNDVLKSHGLTPELGIAYVAESVDRAIRVRSANLQASHVEETERQT